MGIQNLPTEGINEANSTWNEMDLALCSHVANEFRKACANDGGFIYKLIKCVT